MLHFCRGPRCMHARLRQVAGINPHARKTLARIRNACEQRGMKYLFVNTKGGVGKSTLATAFAVYLHDAGRRVAVLDADEQLHSARAIAEAEPGITVVAEFEPNKIPDTITRLADQHDDVVCDAPARLSDETREMMVMADVAIFPMEPTIKCLRSTKESIEVLNYARTVTGGKPEHAWLVLNKAKKRTRLFREVEKLAPSLGLIVATEPIRDLQAFPEADQQGTVVLRVKSDSPSFEKAKSDLKGLFGQIAEV
ncbi:probable partition protein [Rhodopirellula baltica SH 1]|uniref:Probable partition protein n=2 Tax=Rhodopirellula baltica TaxID=265606 RepID=Q7UT61_RHOBA|nr:probable partition protein [Rhodopirellula baltica SH 1]